MRQAVDRDGAVCERLAVIESKLETVLCELAAVRQHVPGQMVQHAERIAVLERSIRSLQWIGGVFATGVIGAFLAHVFGR